ncbi:GNAT family N-acetyltransferase [Halosimplex amylolyticum]|uniref:GNAT family N-acetyltransferase n=1 Tax=Halosimplex amylolyticum TaxID=3396616 RepID=UPI003F56AAD9
MSDSSDGTWTVRPAEAADGPAVHDLWADSFGPPGGEASRWLDLALADGPTQCWVVADTAGDPVGFLFSAEVDRRFLQSYLRGHPVVDSLPTRVAIIHMLGVSPAWRSTGVATALVRRSMDWASERVAVMLVALWRRDDHVDSSGLSTKLGFTHVGTAEEFYDDRVYCPDCGASCSCPATIHVKSLDDEQPS